MKTYNPQEDVKHFMTLCSQDVNETPTIPEQGVLLLRAKLLFEEVKEFIYAAGCMIALNKDLELDVFTDIEAFPDLLEMLDAIADISYVNYGAAAALGVDAQEAFNVVHANNMTKIHPDGTVHKNNFGKIVKPANFVPVDLSHLIVSKD